MAKVHFTLHWNCSHLLHLKYSIKCQPRFKLWILLNKGQPGSNWILMTSMLAAANRAWVCWVCWLCCVVEITQTRTSEFYYLDQLYANKLVLKLSFVSSKNTKPTTPRNSGNSKKTFLSYFSSRSFLAFLPRWIIDAFNWKKFHLHACLLNYSKA